MPEKHSPSRSARLFSVARTNASRMPFQSKEEFSTVSMKSPFGIWSVHCRWPWKPPAIALCPSASSRKPFSASFGLPAMRSRPIMVILTTYSQTFSWSACDLPFAPL